MLSYDISCLQARLITSIPESIYTQDIWTILPMHFVFRNQIANASSEKLHCWELLELAAIKLWRYNQQWLYFEEKIIRVITNELMHMSKKTSPSPHVIQKKYNMKHWANQHMHGRDMTIGDSCLSLDIMLLILWHKTYKGIISVRHTHYIKALTSPSTK